MVATGWVVVQSTWLKREFIFPESSFFRGEREREREREREIQEESGEFKRGIQESEEKCVLGIYPLLLDTPNGCLDQLDPMLALGAALFLHQINKLTCHV